MTAPHAGPALTGAARAAANAEECAALDAVLGDPAQGWSGGERSAADHHVARQEGTPRTRRTRLLAALHAVNDRVGWVSPGAVDEIGRRLGVAPAEVFSVASFYALFPLTPRPSRQVHVCVDLACRAVGGPSPDDVRALHGTHAAGDPPMVHPSPCLGVCERAPAALVIDSGPAPVHAVLAPIGGVAELPPMLASGRELRAEAPVDAALAQTDRSGQVLLRRVGRGEPLDLAAYRAAGGFVALQRAFALGPVAVRAEITASGLTGRGGAAFPTGRKWDAVAAQPAQPHHLVCNADESEPGTFKDRVLIEGDPYALIEAMVIAAYATGCAHGWIYLRGEYPRAMRTMQAALVQARAAGLLGERILGTQLSFDIEVFRGAGAYICGEETAIFNSIEGFRGEPRAKPPFPVEAGLFGRPTLVNNVETLVNVLPVLTRGAAAFASVGSGASTGTKLFCVSGTVLRPGLYEVPFGTTLRTLLDEAGGVPGGRTLRAVLLGGAAGSFVGPTDLDLPLTLEGARAAGATLGSGVVLVIDDSVPIEAVLERIAAFFRAESCGQCVPCRVGTVRQHELVERLLQQPSAAARATDRVLHAQIAQVMRDASICGLGQTAANAIESAMVRLGVLQ